VQRYGQSAASTGKPLSKAKVPCIIEFSHAAITPKRIAHKMGDTTGTGPKIDKVGVFERRLDPSGDDKGQGISVGKSRYGSDADQQ